MIEHGSDIKSQLENDRYKSDLTIAQLLTFSYHPNITKMTVQQRHSLERATPFCVYLVYSSGSSEIWLVVGLSVLNIIASRSTPSLSSVGC
jgi:hypothetical protein